MLILTAVTSTRPALADTPGVTPAEAQAASGEVHTIDFAFLSTDGRGVFVPQQQLDQLVANVSSYWVKASKGQISSFTYSYADVKSAQSSVQCGSDADAAPNLAASLFGYPSAASYEGETRHHLVVMVPADDSCDIGDYAGYASRLGDGLSSGGSIVMSSANLGSNSTLLIRELGHTFGLGHAGAPTCTDGVVDGPIGAGSCLMESINETYGDQRNIMGSGSWQTTGLDGFQKAKLGLIAPGSGLQEITSDGLYDVALQDEATGSGQGVETVKVAEGDRNYWVEYDSRSGGMQIRWSPSGGSPYIVALTETAILSPGRTWNQGTESFTPGQTVTSSDGALTIDVTSATPDVGATLHVNLGHTPEPLSLSQSLWSAPAEASSTSLTVSTSQPSWSAKADQPWLTVTPTSGATGDSITVGTQANTTVNPRTGSVTVTSGSATVKLSVTQAPGCGMSPDTACSWDLSPLLVSPSNPGVLLKFTAAASGQYLFYSSDASAVDAYACLDDMDFTSHLCADDTDNGGIFELTATLEAGQSCLLTTGQFSAITPTHFTVHAKVPDTQQASLSLSQTSWTAPASAGSTSLTVTTNQASWSASSNQAWATVSPATGATGATLTVNTATNTASSPRTATITVTAGSASATFTVTQGAAAGPARLLLTPASSSVTAAAHSATPVTVTTDQPSWQASSDSTWLTINPTNGPTGAKPTITMPANTGPTRTGTITFTAGSATATFTVTQAGGTITPTLSLSQTTWAPAAAADTTSVTVTTNQASWQASSNQTWLTVNPATGSSGNQLTLNVPANSTGTTRTATVLVTAGTATATLTVTQPGSTISPTGCGATPATACGWDLSDTVISPAGTVPQTLKFTAPSSGTWVFQSSGRASTADPLAYMYNSAQTLIGYDDNSAGNLNFKITVQLTAGQTYYLAVRQSSTANTGRYTITATQQ